MNVLAIATFYEFFQEVLKSVFGIDIPSLLDEARETIVSFFNLFAGFPPLFLQLAGFALAGIVVGIIIRLL